MKTILISGANEGIGYFTAKQLLDSGNKVYVFDICTDNIDRLKDLHLDRLNTFICDVGSYEMVESCIGKIEDDLDIIIHNACKCTFDSFADTGINIFEDVFRVNYYGAVNIVKAALHKMKRGRMLFVSSGVAVMGFRNISPYASSKGAIEALAKCLNLEYRGEGISFHIIHPPLTSTKSSEPLPIPSEFMQSPEIVGKGIARKIEADSFVICHSFLQSLQTKLIYLFPLQFGRLFSKLTYDS